MSKPTQHAEYTKADFGRNPLMFYYEVTQACDLVCKHCRASAQENPHPEELTSEQSRALIDQVAGFPRPPMLVLTGGDPLKRADLFDLVRHAASLDLHVALTPSATPLATREAFERAMEVARRCGGSAKFAGSGGSIIGLYKDNEILMRLIVELKKINARVIRPFIY